MVFNFLIAAAVFVAVFVIVVAMRSGTFSVTRKATIAAPASEVFAQVNDFHNWRAWSPWEKIDPELKRTYEGPSAGPGAVYSWTGNSNVGQGRMTITDARPHELIRIKLEFLKPFAATNAAEFSFQPDGDQTAVTWTMSGHNDNFLCKAMGLIMNMDKMVGGQFEQGLANLKSIVESRQSLAAR